MKTTAETIAQAIYLEMCSDYPELCRLAGAVIDVHYPMEHPDFSKGFGDLAGRHFRITVEEIEA